MSAGIFSEKSMLQATPVEERGDEIDFIKLVFVK